MSEGQYLYDDNGKPINRDDSDSEEEVQGTQPKSPPKKQVSLYDEDLYSLPNVEDESPIRTTTPTAPTNSKTTPKIKTDPNPTIKNNRKWKFTSAILLTLLLASVGVNVMQTVDKYSTGM